MSKKNLAKTAIEGGRTTISKWERHNSNKKLRVNEHLYIKNIEKDPEVWDEDEYPTRKKVYKEFHDKLGPVYRYLESQIGRPWNLVRSELIEKFDSRTTAGRHILYDHILSLIERNKFDYYRHYEFHDVLSDKESLGGKDYYIDKYGLFQVTEKVSYKVAHDRVQKLSKIDEARKFINNRVIKFYNGQAFWFKPLAHIFIHLDYNRIYWTTTPEPNHDYVANYKDIFLEAYFNYDVPLTKDELKILYSLPDNIKKLIIV